jgi:hypothetical protein
MAKLWLDLELPPDAEPLPADPLPPAELVPAGEVVPLGLGAWVEVVAR